MALDFDQLLVETKVPERFTDFCAWLGIKLYPGQRALYRVLYDGDEPRDLSPEERAIVDPMLGGLDVIPPECRRVIVLVVGARGGKTYMAALRGLHLALTVKLPPMAPNQTAWTVIVAPNPRQREESYNNVVGAINSHPHLRSMLVGKPGVEVVKLRRDDGRLVAVESLPANRGGLAGRGRVLCGAILEEAAFFGGTEHVVSDTEVFAGLMPRVTAAGQCIVSSTPYLESGLLFKEFVDNHPTPWVASPHLKTPGRPHRALAAHAPTLALRDVEETRVTIAIEKARDPLKCAREYFAQFITAGTGQWFDSAFIAAALGDTRGDGIASVGLDVALKSDHTGYCAARLGADGKIRVQDLAEEVPGVGQPLMPGAVVARAVNMAVAMNAETIVSDGVYEGTVREQVAAVPTLAHCLCPDREVIFTAAKLALASGKVILPAGHGKIDQFVQQLRSVRGKEKPGGGVSIELERSDDNGHCDLVSAFCAVVWRLSKLTPPAPVVKSENLTKVEIEALKFQEAARRIRQRAAATSDADRVRQRWWRRGSVA